MVGTNVQLNESYTVTEIRFEISNNANLGGAAGGGGAGKSKFDGLVVEFLVDSGAAPLARALRVGGQLELGFTVPDPGGPTTPLIYSNLAMAQEVSFRTPRNANQQTLVRALFQLGDATVTWGSHSAEWSQVTNTGSCASTACGCTPSAMSPTFVSANGQSPTLAPDEYLVDSFTHYTATSVFVGSQSGGGASAGRPSDQGVDAIGDLNDSYLCLFRATTLATPMGSMAFKSSAVTQGAAAFDHEFEYSCLGFTTDLRLYSDANGDLKVQSYNYGGALQEIYRDIDPVTGSETGSASTVWSYVRNDETNACQ